LSKDLHAKDLI